VAARARAIRVSAHRKSTADVVTGREFFNVVTVWEALAGFRPSRRTNVESVPFQLTGDF